MGTSKWQELAKTYTNGVVQIVFVDGDGALAKLPAEFVEALASHSILDVDVVPSSTNPQLIRIVRGGKDVGIVPLSLLQALAARRQNETETETS